MVCFWPLVGQSLVSPCVGFICFPCSRRWLASRIARRCSLYVAGEASTLGSCRWSPTNRALCLSMPREWLNLLVCLYFAPQFTHFQVLLIIKNPVVHISLSQLTVIVSHPHKPIQFVLPDIV